MKPAFNLLFVNFFPLNWRTTSSAFSGLMMVAVLSTPSAHAATSTWTGTTSTDWNTAGNWSAGIPTAGNAIINTTPANIATITANPSVNPTDILIGSGASTNGRVDLRAGLLRNADIGTVGGTTGNWTLVGHNGGTGILNIADTSAAGAGISGFAQGTGSLTVGKLWVGGAYFGDNGTGTVNVNTTGTITANSQNNPFNDNNAVATIILGQRSTGVASGTINLESGTIQGNGRVYIGRNATGIVNQSGGTFNSTAQFVIGRDSGGNGTFNLSGGTVNATTSTSYTSIATASGSTGLLNVSGGTYNASTGGILVGEGGAGTLTVSGTGLVNLGTANYLVLGSTGTGTANLNGGTIQAKGVSKVGGTGTFNFNGGILKATVANTTFMTGLNAANVMAGGANIDSDGFNITIGQALLDGGGNGGLVKSSGGTLTLSGANTYTGTTTISGGSLQIGNGGTTGSISTSSAIVNNSNLTINRSNAVTQGTDFSGAAITGSGSFTQAGSGTTTLTATNTYAGATAVQSGKLVISGSIENSAVTVTGTNTTLASGTTGTIGSSVTINSGAILAAGNTNAIGSATVGSGGTTLNSGSIFSWDLDTTAANTAGTGYDNVVTSSLGGTSAVFAVVLKSGQSFTDTFWNSSHSWDNVFSTTGLAANALGMSSIFSGFTYNGSGSAPVNGAFTFTGTGGNTLTWSAVPEPTTALGGLLLGAGLLRRNRRRDRGDVARLQ